MIPLQIWGLTRHWRVKETSARRPTWRKAWLSPAYVLGMAATLGAIIYYGPGSNTHLMTWRFQLFTALLTFATTVAGCDEDVFESDCNVPYVIIRSARLIQSCTIIATSLVDVHLHSTSVEPKLWFPTTMAGVVLIRMNDWDLIHLSPWTFTTIVGLPLWPQIAIEISKVSKAMWHGLEDFGHWLIEKVTPIPGALHTFLVELGHSIKSFGGWVCPKIRG